MVAKTGSFATIKRGGTATRLSKDSSESVHFMKGVGNGYARRRTA